MGLLRNTNAIIKAGSGQMGMKVSDATGTVTGSLICNPVIMESTLSDVTSTDKLPDEGGNTYTVNNTREVTFTAKYMQADKDSIISMVDTYRDGYHTLVKRLNETVVKNSSNASVYNFLVIPIAKVTSELNMALRGNEIEAKWDVLPNESQVVVALGDFAGAFPGITLSGLFTIPANKYWGIYEHTAS